MMSAEDALLELMTRSEEKHAWSAPLGAGELLWLVIVFLWALASVVKFVDAEWGDQRDWALIWAMSLLASSIVAVFSLQGLL